MDRNSSYLCGHCNETCGSNSVKCNHCSAWFHAKCEKLSQKDMRILISAKSGYMCGSCADNDYRASLRRISAAAKCYSHLEKAVKRESVIMREPFVVTDELPTIHVYFQRSTDTVTMRLQEQYGLMLDRRPLSVSGDGNCLFNAVSVALCGTERLADELRVRTVIEMVMSADKYKNSPNAKTYLSLAPSYKDACVACGKNGAFSSVWTILALSAVIGRPIRSVYPPCNGTDGSNGFIVRSLNTTFLPDRHCKSEPIYIMWTSIMQKPRKGLWSPNHFVPLLALTDIPGIASVPQTDFSHQSPTYQQEFPDLTSSMKATKTQKRQKMSQLVKKKTSKKSKHYEQDSEHDFSSSFEEVQSAKRQKLTATPSKNNRKPPKQDFPDLSSSFDENSQSPEQQTASKVNSSPCINMIDMSSVQTDSTPTITQLPPLPKNSTPINKDTFVLDEKTSVDFIENESISTIRDTTDNAETVKSHEQVNNNYGQHACESTQKSQSELNQGYSNLNIDADNESAMVQNDIPEGGFALKRNNLSTKDLYRLITTSDKVWPQIPNGIKSNCYFLVDNAENIRRLENKDHATYHDDCGVWDYKDTRTVQLTYVLRDNSLRYVKKENANYCVKKVQSKIVTWVPLEPQPDHDQIVVLKKYYTTLKRSQSYSKHVSWFSKLPSQFQQKASIAVVEYTGHYPVNNLSVHGHNKTENRQYVRTHPETKNAIKEQLKQNVPVRKIYQDLTNKNPEIAPRDYRVIENLKRQEKKQTSQTSPGDSLADEMLQVFKLLRTHPFVQEVNSTKSHAPTVILYTEEQMKDFQFFLSRNTDYVVGVDRTFNLGATYVTCFTYKSLRVQRPRSRDHPVFFGPMYLHWDGTFESYHYFFSHLRAHISNPVGNTELQVGDAFRIGSDDEKALTKALDICFPDSERYLCTKHMKDNLSHFLMRKEEMDEKHRNRLVSEIFNPGGLVDADNTFAFEELSSKLKSENQKYQQFVKYFDGSLKTRILKHVNKHRRQNAQTLPLWTNNACESLNAVLKRDIDWKPQKIPDLIETLYKAVTFQINGLKASLSGSGVYSLAPGYGHYLVPSVVWGSKSDEEKDRMFNNFLLDKKRRVHQKTVKARDVSYEVPNEQKLAKKIGQKKNKAKTTKKYYK